MDEITIPKADVGYNISLQANDADGNAKDCSTYTTYKLQVWAPGNDPETPANLLIDASIAWTDDSTGDGYYTIAEGDFDSAGTYHARIYLAKTGVEERLETFAIIVDGGDTETWEIVTLDEAKTYLRIDGTTEDFDVIRLIKTACEYCEGRQRRTYINQTRYLWLNSFPDKDHIDIPYPPLQSVTSVKYYDTDDTEHEFSSSYYYVDTENDPGAVSLNYGQSWPSTLLRPRNGVCVTYVAGYGTAYTSVPEKVRQAAMMLIHHWYENRETVLVGAISKEIEYSVESLLWMDRSF